MFYYLSWSASHVNRDTLVILNLASNINNNNRNSAHKSNYGSEALYFCRIRTLEIWAHIHLITSCIHLKFSRSHGEKGKWEKRDEAWLFSRSGRNIFMGGDITTSFHTRGNKHFFLFTVDFTAAVVGHHCYIMSKLGW